MFYPYIFIIGMIIASFGLLCAYRIPREESIIKGRSHCDYCGHELRWYDLIPVISYIATRGKCRYCGHELSLIYPLYEVMGGILIVLCFMCYGVDIKTFTSFVIIMILEVIALIDYRTMDIYNSTQGALLVAGIIHRLAMGPFSLTSIMLSAVIVSGFMLIFNRIVNDTFGMGDIEMMAITGVFLSPSMNIMAMIIGIFASGIGYFIKRFIKKDESSHLAFAPYLVFGIIVAMFYGEKILSWYLSLF